MPGTRHAKNNTALGYFTRHERAKLGWGSRRERLSKDSIKQFYACTICLKLCEQPMLCPNGDLFCKECIYQSLLAQKRKHKQQMADYNEQMLKDQMRAQTEDRRNVVDKFLQFERLNNPTVNPSGVPLGQDQSHLSSLNKTPFKRAPASNIIDAAKCNPSLSAPVNHDAAKKGKLNCFWIPSLTPDAGPKALKPPDMKTYCPGCNQPLRMKQLVECQFTQTAQDRDILPKTEKRRMRSKRVKSNALKPNEEVALYECASCAKMLSNATKCGCLKKCGHILCLQCITQFVSRSKCCPVCDEPCRKRHVIMLSAGGTGFSARGTQMEATKKAVAFQ